MQQLATLLPKRHVSGMEVDPLDDSDGSDADGVAAASTDVRGTVTALMATLEDVVHQLAEHRRVVEVCGSRAVTGCVCRRVLTRSRSVV